MHNILQIQLHTPVYIETHVCVCMYVHICECVYIYIERVCCIYIYIQMHRYKSTFAGGLDIQVKATNGQTAAERILRPFLKDPRQRVYDAFPNKRDLQGYFKGVLG